jgi:hypothetical protein
LLNHVRYTFRCGISLDISLSQLLELWTQHRQQVFLSLSVACLGPANQLMKPADFDHAPIIETGNGIVRGEKSENSMRQLSGAWVFPELSVVL